MILVKIILFVVVLCRSIMRRFMICWGKILRLRWSWRRVRRKEYLWRICCRFKLIVLLRWSNIWKLGSKAGPLELPIWMH